MNTIEEQTFEALASLIRHPQAIGQLPGHLQQQIVEDPIRTLARLMESTGKYTQLISGTETLTLDHTDGTETIAGANNVFKSGIDSDFVNWKCNLPGVATAKQNVGVHEIIQDGNFAQVFGSFGTNLDCLCLSQAQIIQFVQNHKKWLHKEYATFFLFKVGSEFFVAVVYVYSGGGLGVYLSRFSFYYVWDAKSRHRVVIPQSLTT